MKNLKLGIFFYSMSNKKSCQHLIINNSFLVCFLHLSSFCLKLLPLIPSLQSLLKGLSPSIFAQYLNKRSIFQFHPFSDPVEDSLTGAFPSLQEIFAPGRRENFLCSVCQFLAMGGHLEQKYQEKLLFNNLAKDMALERWGRTSTLIWAVYWLLPGAWEGCCWPCLVAVGCNPGQRGWTEIKLGNDE